MNIKTRYRPELACSSGPEYRPQLQHPYLTWAGEVSVLIATNGRFLVQVPVEVDKATEPDGHVTFEALRLARQFRPNKKGDTYLTLDADYVTLPNGWKLPRPKELPPFPNWQQVIPGSNGVKVRLGISAKYLFDAARAIGTDQIVLEIRDELSPVTIRPIDKQDPAFAVLMPVRVSSSPFPDPAP